MAPAECWLRVPRATYRLQLSRDLTFSDVAGLAAYLAVLGVSDLYASPLMRARPGSTHGVSFARLHGEGAAITVAPRLYARLTGGDGPLIPAPEIWLWRNLDESKAVAFVDPMIVLGGVQEASLQQLEVRPPVHLALDELQAVDLAFCLPAAPLVC